MPAARPQHHRSGTILTTNLSSGGSRQPAAAFCIAEGPGPGGLRLAQAGPHALVRAVDP